MFNPLKTLKALVKDGYVREKIQEEKTQDESIKVLTGVQICPLESIQDGMVKLYKTQSSDETMLIEARANTAGDLFVHRYQTDQLLVVRGSCVLVILYNRQYQYIPLSSNLLQVVIIPAGIFHGLINLNDEDCWLINAILRHGKTHPKDYQPVTKPFSYNIERAQLSLQTIEAKK